MYFSASSCVDSLVLPSSVIELHEVSVIRQTEIHTAESLVPKPRSFEVEIAIEKLKR
jgi:hypothetical protein